MKKFFIPLNCLVLFYLSACSPIDSVRPFDAEQARKLIESNFIAKPAQQRIVRS